MKDRISKLTLGTAQLGLSYGINSEGQPPEKESFEILEYAFKHGINSIDTSPNYGSSEKIIGEFVKANVCSNLFLTTKLEAQNFSKEIWSNKKLLSQKIKYELWLSCNRLHHAWIQAYILHYARDAFRNNGIILDILTDMKNKGYIDYIGTSLYTGEELEKCIDDERIDIVQVPFSILDRRLLDSGLLEKAHKRGLIIFARSVFMQGLVFMKNLPRHLEQARESLNELHPLANICHMSINELCLRYVLSIHEISSLVVGVDSLKQLKNNIEIVSLGSLDKDTLRLVEQLPQMPDELIDIRSWGQKFDFTKGE